MDSTLEQKDDELNAAEAIVEERLSFLKSYANGLVPDPQDTSVPFDRRAELKKEEDEMNVRINELERLLRLMRHN